MERIREDSKIAALVVATAGTPIVTASLLLTGFFAYSLFPTLLISLLTFPAGILSLGLNLLAIGLTLRWRLRDESKFASAALAASGVYLALHAFFFYMTISLGR